MPFARPIRLPGRIDLQHPVSDHALNKGLVALWLALPFPGYRGEKFVDLKGRNHGVLTNTPTWGGTIGRAGQFGSLATVGLSGSGSYVAFGDLGLSGATGVTLVANAMWQLPGDGAGFPMAVSDGSFDNEDFGFGAFSGDNVFAIVRDGGGTRRVVLAVSSPGTAAASYWSIVADDSELRTYQNTTLLGSTAKASGFDIVGGFAIGTNGQRIQAFATTRVWSVGLWKRALSVEEIAAWIADANRGYQFIINRSRRATVFDAGGAQPAVGTARGRRFVGWAYGHG